MKKLLLLLSLFAILCIQAYGQKNNGKPEFNFGTFSPKKGKINASPQSSPDHSALQETSSFKATPSKKPVNSPQTVRQEKVKILFAEGEPPLECTVTIKDGYVFLADDIVLWTEEEYALKKLEKGGIINGNFYRWPNARIPYVLPNDHEAYDDIVDAIDHLNQKANICLVPRTDEQDYIEFVADKDACFSSVGKRGGRQVVNVSRNCGFGAAVHEICHAAGMWHEQSRNDRDTYVTILEENIEEEYAHNFRKLGTSITDVGAYDYNSLMHYGAYDFSKNGQPTIKINIPPGTAATRIGQRDGLSAGDIATLKEMYPTKSCERVDVDLPLISMYAPLKVSPDPLVIGKTFTISTNFINRGTAPFLGCYLLALFDPEDELVTTLEIEEKNGLPIDYIYSSNLVFQGTLDQNLKPGRYVLAAFYYNNCEGEAILVDDTDYPSFIEVEVVANGTLALTVNPGSLIFGSTGGTKDFSITSNTTWTISESLSWLSLSATSGSNNQTISVSCLANTSTTSRTGTITISGTGVASKTITVTQDAAAVSCASPANLRMIEKGYAHFYLAWDPVPEITTYSWRYKKPSETTWTTNDTWNATNVISSLKTPCSEYVFQVRAVCGSNNYSAWSPEFTIKTDGCNDPYCYSYGIAFSDWIKSIKFGDLSVTSDKNYGNGNFTNKTATLEPGKAYPLELIAGTDEANSRGSTYYWQVWIDYNQDNDFSDAGELIYASTATRTNSVAGLKNDITIPAATKLGKTRMRVAMSLQAGENACSTIATGNNFREVEDYALEFKSATKFLTATPTTISFPATAETQNITIASNVAWTVSESISWLSVSPITGSNNGQVRVSCVANATTNPRSGTITISGAGVADQKIAVTQLGIPTCPVPTNFKLDAVGDSWFTATWDTIPGNTFVLNYKNGTDTNWSTIDDWNTNDLVWSCRTPCSEYVIQIRAKCGTSLSAWTPELRIKTTGCDATYCHSYGVSYEDWIAQVRFAGIDKSSYSNFGYGKFIETTGKATRGQNYDFSLLPGVSSTSETNTYYCKVWIDFNQNNNFDETNELVFTTSAAKAEALKGFLGKINIPIAAKLGKTRVRVALSATNDGPCSADCNFREVEDYTLDIQEEAKFLNVSPTALSVSASAGSGDLNITSNTSWTVSESIAWLSVSATSGSNNGKISVICLVNASSTPRTATLTISGIGVITQTITITQAGGNPTLSVSPNTLTFGSGGGSLFFDVTSNLNWTAQESLDWLNLDVKNGLNNGKVSVSCSANTAASSRTGTITVSGNGVADQRITVTQAGVGSACSVPKNLKNTYIEHSAFWVAWDSVPGAQSYNTRMRPTNSTQWKEGRSIYEVAIYWNIPPNTRYEFQVQSVCSNGKSDWSPSFFTTTLGAGDPYCFSYGDSDYGDIDGFKLGETVFNSPLSQGFGNYTTQSAPVETGKSYDIELSASDWLGTGTKPAYWRIWIDFNRDNDYNDSGELVFEATGNNDSKTLGKITIPSNVTAGKTRVRIALDLDAQNGPCSFGGRREVEDYSVEIKAAATPILSVSPTSLAFSAAGESKSFNITSNTTWAISESITWLKVSGTSGSNNGAITVTCDANPTTTARTGTITITGANVPAQTITVTQTGAAPPLCRAPSNLRNQITPDNKANSISYSWFFVYWDAVPGAIGYSARLRPVGATSWREIKDVTVNQVDFRNLQPNTNFEVQVQSFCDDGAASAWSGSLITTTLGAGELYCFSYGDPQFGEISAVVLGDNTLESGVSNGYAFYKNKIHPIVKGRNYRIELVANDGQNTGVKPAYWRIWIDFNKDKDFNDPNELVFEAEGKNNAPVTGVLGISSDYDSGETRMRIALDMDAQNGPCSTKGNREVEDYLINIGNAENSWNEVVQTEQSHIIVVPENLSSKIGESTLQINDQIGFFYTDKGIEYCAGKAIWTGKNVAITVYGDDLSSPQKDGFSSQEAFHIKVWQTNSGNEYKIKAIYAPIGTFGIANAQGQYVNDGISVLSSLGQSLPLATQVIPLQEGWNMISSYLAPKALDLDSILRPVRTSLQMFKNAAGKSFLFVPAINDIGPWNSTEGYRIKVNKAAILTLSGLEIAPSLVAVPIHAGWQIIPFLGQEAMSIESALSSIRDKIIMVKNNAGAVYIPGELAINNIGTLEPGQGYLLKSSSAGQLQYPASGLKPGPTLRNDLLLQHFKMPHNYNSGQNSTLILSKTSIAPALEIGDELGVFNAAGHLCGAGRFSGDHLAITVWGDDPTQAGAQGLSTDEPYLLKIWGKAVNQEFATITNLKDKGYRENDLVVVTALEKLVTTRTRNELLPNASLVLSPNPTAGLLYIQSVQNLPGKVLIQIMSLDGRIVQTRTYLNGLLAQQSESFDLSQLPAGMYQVQVRSGMRVWNQKVSLVH